MSLTFDGHDIPGEHGPLMYGSPEVHRREVKFFQIRGVGEVAGEVGARSIAVVVLVHDSYDTENKLQDKLDELNDLVGINSSLEEDGNLTRSLDYCTFEGWEPIPHPGQEYPGPILDVSGTLDFDGDDNPVFGWTQLIVLRFRQLRWK